MKVILKIVILKKYLFINVFSKLLYNKEIYFYF